MKKFLILNQYSLSRVDINEHLVIPFLFTFAFGRLQCNAEDLCNHATER